MALFSLFIFKIFTPIYWNEELNSQGKKSLLLHSLLRLSADHPDIPAWVQIQLYCNGLWSSNLIFTVYMEAFNQYLLIFGKINVIYDKSKLCSKLYNSSRKSIKRNVLSILLPGWLWSDKQLIKPSIFFIFLSLTYFLRVF